ncbi:hypothetical protein [Edaphobacter aggregans]|uniref:hypothetical protein n=1 Tax=Edaphobacter aggregans TaxID=570835 RepID=UPI001C8BAB6E|nr:hypothetical protein [Edaphobacter aggregans]
MDVDAVTYDGLHEYEVSGLHGLVCAECIASAMAWFLVPGLGEGGALCRGC